MYIIRSGIARLVQRRVRPGQEARLILPGSTIVSNLNYGVINEFVAAHIFIEMKHDPASLLLIILFN
jgi:hypothetical protein